MGGVLSGLRMLARLGGACACLLATAAFDFNLFFKHRFAFCESAKIVYIDLTHAFGFSVVEKLARFKMYLKAIKQRLHANPLDSLETAKELIDQRNYGAALTLIDRCERLHHFRVNRAIRDRIDGLRLIAQAGRRQCLLQAYKDLRSLEDFNHFRDNHPWLWSARSKVDPGDYLFFSYPAQKIVKSKPIEKHRQLNAREDFCCPVTNLNARARLAVQLVDQELKLGVDSSVYITEQVTDLYRYLSCRFPRILGSEYLGESCRPGDLAVNGVRHESLEELSFESNSFDAILSFDVLEHVSDVEACFREARRVLKPGGRFLWTAPFVINEYKNTIRALIRNGEIVHLLEPEYHGDPVGSGQGVLCFRYFGWEVLRHQLMAGFSDAYVILVYHPEFGYEVPLPAFVAVK